MLSEIPGSRKLIPDSIMGEPCFVSEQSFESPTDEFIFGLGQFQDGHYNLKGVSHRLIQVNSQIAIPFIFSSKGYGLLWHQYGLTDFNPADNFISLDKQDKSTESERVLSKTDTNPSTLNNMAVIFLEEGDLDNAKKLFTEAVNGGSTEAHHNLR
ncbi:hypothetical protein CLV62_10613 [Dysgonomonas alginatilytica]|uniref:Tetratricopeptide repeat protein n=2 Tax=Dysgonomonas alginatilytica TaxID=1605892 RepID=A0A2V3PT41_9BACT|nr:hypothetical protein [Dysgonomonas alginatilytica]PXV65840.1 hypothetical protein CLV62_10613 [Dysgonomonas alginatilytica]